MRERHRSWPAQLRRFLAIGAAGTAAYVALYLLVRHGLAPQPANIVARVTVAVVTTGLAYRVAFDVRASLLRVLGTALLLLLVSTAVSAGLLGTLAVADPHAGRVAEVGTLLAANLTATVVRFVALRHLTATPWGGGGSARV